MTARSEAGDLKEAVFLPILLPVKVAESLRVPNRKQWLQTEGHQNGHQQRAKVENLRVLDRK